MENRQCRLAESSSGLHLSMALPDARDTVGSGSESGKLRVEYSWTFDDILFAYSRTPPSHFMRNDHP
jgi:hypothetical protein